MNLNKFHNFDDNRAWLLKSRRLTVEMLITSARWSSTSSNDPHPFEVSPALSTRGRNRWRCLILFFFFGSGAFLSLAGVSPCDFDLGYADNDVITSKKAF
jgi:hypothetical protein